MCVCGVCVCGVWVWVDMCGCVGVWVCGCARVSEDVHIVYNGPGCSISGLKVVT